MAGRRRYGTYGRAITFPASMFSSNVEWQHQIDMSRNQRTVESPCTIRPSTPPLDASSRRVEKKIKHRFTNDRLRSAHIPAYGDDRRSSIQELMNRYLNKSRELVPSSVSRSTSRTDNVDPNDIKMFMGRSERENIETTHLSGSTSGIRYDLSDRKSICQSTKRSSFGCGTCASHMPVSSGSRSGRLARISQSNIRPFGSAGAGGGYGPGGHPLSGPDPSCPSKKDVKHRFEITKKLGSGTYGKVSLAYDHKFDREVAVKLIKKSAIENKADLVRIRREIRIMSALYHPNIIQIFEVFENRDKIILVMEYASGGELYDYVSNFGSLPESEARRIFRQIVSAVLYCHKNQVAHRDLKLENILLDQDNNAKIADFGLSNYFGTKSLLTTFCGSPLYASPEIINGTPYRGPEVDCWSLGILLYTLVYGSMPFDGRDFNRMVRQIKRGAYYEPDTPSTASMLIRNMLRVNPERRADIFEIASHWWLNLEENMPVIQELPENQITDHTPLTERAETMVVQDLADETDVFMEFGHLSSETRRKIEEFRRRRKQAEEFNENSPVKPPKAARKDGEPIVEMRNEEKSLRGTQEHTKEKETEKSDPLERLRQIENRLGQQRKKSVLDSGLQTLPMQNENDQGKSKQQHPQEQTSVSKSTRNEALTDQENSSRAPTFVPLSKRESPITRQNSTKLRPPSTTTYRIEVDSLNMLMNQVLEQMENGPVSLNLIARIKAHPMYEVRPMVKELLESIITAQPENVQKQTSKIIQQQSQELIRKTTQLQNCEARTSTFGNRAEKFSESGFGERPWHSVEVGFDPDEESGKDSTQQPSFGISTMDDVITEQNDDAHGLKHAAFSTVMTPGVTTEVIDVEDEADTEDEEYTDSEMEELADEVEQVEQEIAIEQSDALPPPDPVVTKPQCPNPFDRGLLKRQSKGKYQHSRVDLYGRGVSTECESPTLPRKPLGGPQPTNAQSPFLFDKAKKIIMLYPGRPDLSEIEDGAMKKNKKSCSMTQEYNKQTEDDVGVEQSVGSVFAPIPQPCENNERDSQHSINEEAEECSEEECSEEEYSSEQSETTVERCQHRGPIIGEIRRDGDKIEMKTIDATGRRLSFMQSAPASIHSSQSPESKSTSSLAKYHDSISEFKQPSSDSKFNMKSSEENLASKLATLNSEPNDRRTQESVQYTVIQKPKNNNRAYGNVYDGPFDNLPSKNTRGYFGDYRRLDDEPLPSIRFADSIQHNHHHTVDHCADLTHSRTSGMGTTDLRNYYSSNASPSFSRKLDENQSWACEPRRFEVYKTRAERDAERNCLAPIGSAPYRPVSYYSSGSDRPTTNFCYRKPPDDQYRVDSYGATDLNRHRFDDGFSYRKGLYEFERGVSPGPGQQVPASTSVLPNSNPPILNRFRQTTRRVISNGSDSCTHTRTRSMDRKQFGANDFACGEINAQPYSPEPVGDYTYVNFHDSLTGIASVTKDEKRIPKSILKNKQSVDLEQRNGTTENFTRSNDVGNGGPVRSVIDRLRRHLSLEKSASPQAQSTILSERAPMAKSTPNSRSSQDRDSKKKRSLLSFTRRRTSEVHMGSDGKMIINGCDDTSNNKQSNSSFDKIKSLFRKSDVSNSSLISNNDCYSGRYTTAAMHDKLYSTNPSTNLSSSKDIYVPLYRRFPGSTTRDSTLLMNRYSYTPGLTDQRRHYHDDHNIY